MPPAPLSTAWAEYNQGFVQHSALIAQLRLDHARHADLTELDAGRTPATHELRTRLMGQGFNGVVYPSFMSPGGTCVALWRWNGEGEPKLGVIDPDRTAENGGVMALK